jgi:hypothetical protein
MIKQEGLDVFFSRIDGDKYPGLMERFNIKEVPTIVWFNNIRDHIITYTGETEMPSYFIEHVKIQMSFQTQEVTFDQWKNLTKNAKFNDTNVIVYVGHPVDNLQVFKLITNSAWNNYFKNIFWSNDTKFLDYYNLSDNLKNDPNIAARCLIFKIRDHYVNLNLYEEIKFTNSDFSEDKSIKSIFDMKLPFKNTKLDNIMKLYSKEIVNIFNHENEAMIVNAIPTIILAHNYELNSPEFNNMLSALIKVALKYRREIFFMFGSPRTKFTQVLTESFRLSPKEFPTLCMTSLGEQNLNYLEKYRRNLKFESDLAHSKIVTENFFVEKITEFIQEWKSMKLKPYISSEDIPKEPTDENGITKLVGLTFKDAIETPGKDVLLLLCSNKVDICNKFREIYIRVYRKLKANEKIMFTEADPYENELDFTGYGHIPGIILFLDKGKKFSNFEEYKGKLTTKEIVKFLKEKVVHPLKHEDSLPAQEVLYRGEEINEIKSLNLGQRGVVNQLHEKMIDPDQKEMYKFVDKEVMDKEIEYLLK